jgi:hypothetical protein
MQRPPINCQMLDRFTLPSISSSILIDFFDRYYPPIAGDTFVLKTKVFLFLGMASFTERTS